MKTTYGNQSSIEKLVYPIDFTNSLLTAETVSSASATHSVYPSGSALTITTSVSTPTVYVTIPTGLVAGTNVIRVTATTSNGNIIAHELVIKTKS